MRLQINTILFCIVGLKGIDSMTLVYFNFVFLISLVLRVLFTPAPPMYKSPEAGCGVAYKLFKLF